MKRIEGETPEAATGMPLSKVAVIDVALLMTPEVLGTPEIMTTTSLPLVGKFVPTMASSVVLETVTEVTVGELEFCCAYWQLDGVVLPQLYLLVPNWILRFSSLAISIDFVRHVKVP